MKKLWTRDKLNEDGLKMMDEIESLLSPFLTKRLREYDRPHLELLLIKAVTYQSAMVSLHIQAHKREKGKWLDDAAKFAKERRKYNAKVRRKVCQ